MAGRDLLMFSGPDFNGDHGGLPELHVAVNDGNIESAKVCYLNYLLCIFHITF